MTSNPILPEFEILIATMNRNTLDFLVPMFPEGFSRYQILIVNQTQEDKLLVSEFGNIRVINSFEIGLSKSRNLAIANSNAKIALIADDDLTYTTGFDRAITDAFEVSNDAIITFNHIRTGNKQPQNTASEPFTHNEHSIWNVCSIEIAFRPAELKRNNLLFDENFGLGAAFEIGEELLFLKTALDRKMSIGYNPFVIATHPLVSSGTNQGEDKLVFARAAISYKLYGILAYLWLPKFLFFLLRKHYINASEISRKFKIGRLGILKYKHVKKSANQ